jgi:predicted acyl esterase
MAVVGSTGTEGIMSEAEKIYVPSNIYVEGPDNGYFSPFDPGTRTLAAGFQLDPNYRALASDIVFEKDIAVTLRDGITICIDVLRPAGVSKAPVIIAWSPYGKSSGMSPNRKALFGLLGMDAELKSGLEKFEGPDPAYWCAHGYAICNPDPRGIGRSEGRPSRIWGCYRNLVVGTGSAG